MLREIANKSHVAAQTLQALVNKVNVKVHDSTMRKRLNKYDLFGRAARRKLTLCLDMTEWLKFAKLPLNMQQKTAHTSGKHGGGGLMNVGLFYSHRAWTCCSFFHKCAVRYRSKSDVFLNLPVFLLRRHTCQTELALPSLCCFTHLSESESYTVIASSTQNTITASLL